MTYTYRTHDLGGPETTPRRLPGSADLNIDDWKGRWQFYIEGFIKHGVELKIDKRSQLVNYGLDWVNYYDYRRANAKTQAELDEWSSIHQPNNTNPSPKTWSNCFTFAGHVYNRMGLTIAGNDGADMFPAASAVDEAPGSLRFFWSDVAVANSWTTDPSHVGLIGPNTFLGYGTRVDNNGAPPAADAYAGPTWRGLDDGVGDAYVAGPTGYEPKSQTLPATRGGINPITKKTESLLQELDAE